MSRVCDRRLILSALIVVAVVALAQVGGAVAQPRQGSSGPRVELQGDRLSIEVEDRPWGSLLEEFRRRTGITLHVLTSLPKTVTVSIQGVRVEQAVKRLFGVDLNYLFLYDGEPTAAASPSEIWVFPKGAKLPTGAMARSSAAGQLAKATTVAERLRGIRALADRDDAQALSRLITALRDPTALIRKEAAQALGDLENESVVDDLAQLMLTDTEKAVRLAAVDALGELGSPRALEALARAVSDAESAVRRSAIDAIAEIGGERAVKILREALKHKDQAVRRAAADALKDQTR